MSYDPTQYVLLTPMWEVFTDKDTLTFLRGGYAHFYCDNDRAQYKEVYQLNGTGGPTPSYSYATYGFLTGGGNWRVNLNMQGAFDQVVYGFPFDENGNPQLYYIEFFNADGVPQFSRQAWPNLDTGSSAGTAVTNNLVPNPQFYSHQNIPNPMTTSSTVAGQITQTETFLAYGGWYFEKNNTSATDIVTFNRIATYTAPPPTGNARYNIRVQCTTPGSSENFKYLAIRYNDVNKFANAPGDLSEKYTFAFTGFAASATQVSIAVVQNYGTGGSATRVTQFGPITIQNSYPSTMYTQSIYFPSNDGKTIGTNDDDYVEVAIALPTNASFDFTFQNFILAFGLISNPLFFELPDSYYLYQSLFAAGTPGNPYSTPYYNNANLGLPLILGRYGITYDNSSISSVEYFSSYNPNDWTDGVHNSTNLLLANGATYETSAVSSFGIPYSRLQAKYWNDNINMPIYGTGSSYLTIYQYPSASNLIRITQNAPGAVTAPTDGTPATGFSFENIHAGVSTYNVTAFYYGSEATNLVKVLNNQIGVATPPTAGTSGFTVGITRPGHQIGTPLVQQIIDISTIAATTLAGKYFQFSSTTTLYYVWFTVAGVGSDPAPGGTGIQINLQASNSAADVAQIISEALNGYNQNLIGTVAGSAVPAGSYFNLNTATDNFYVWFTVNGAGTDPAPLGRTAIPVAILSTDTNSEVAAKIQIANNSKYFAVPNYYEMFQRMWVPNGESFIFDTSTSRSSNNSSWFGNNIGTTQFDEIYAHNHTVDIDANYEVYQYELPYSGTGRGNGDDTLPSLTESTVTQSLNVNGDTGVYGGIESRPYNTYLLAAIRY
ncbi:hypothetical protein E6Q11_06560 [Candidatus Dojkabacteria bacterium]|uniref:Uncharacterized protein n=1 Tax=Candidatus Dojkabacteria bacterium TaxID=2099670 RepID=A0A5C7J348_9BACT|nr:MAG: hypothetical protein E6Q11_06560 [Candidatus Dojkabacteria bacterium]